MSARIICLGCAALCARPELCTADRYHWAQQCSCGGATPEHFRELRAELNELEARAARERR